MNAEKTPDSESTPPKSPGSWQRRFGNLLYWLGILSLPAVLGMAIGFYAADQGVRWLPSMLELLLLTCLAALMIIPLGRILTGTARNEDQKVRKRVMACLAFAVIAILIRLGLFWAELPSPLTALSPGEFNEAFEMDAKRYQEYVAALDSLASQLEAREDIFDSEAVLNADQEAMVRDTWAAIYRYTFALDQIRAYYEDWYRFDPSRAQRSYHLRSYLLTYGAEVMLYDTGTRVVPLIEQNPNAVKFLEAPHPSHALPERSFSRFKEELLGSRDHARVVAGKKYLQWLDKGLSARKDAAEAGCTWLWVDVDKTLASVEQNSAFDRSFATVGAELNVFKRKVQRKWYPIQSDISIWVGDTKMRRVGSYLISHDQQEEMDKALEPGDVMLSRKNWYLSNIGLPGFWPHAILYTGGPDKFKAYFDTPEVKAWVQSTGEGVKTLDALLQVRHPLLWMRYLTGDHGEPYRVIEAISEGVVFNTLEHACGDFIVALRPRNLDKVAKAQAICEAFKHIDKPYDFEFDFATDHALVCTEVVYRSYRPATGKPGLNFPVKTVMGRETLPANDIAEMYTKELGTPEQQLDFVYFLDAKESEAKSVVSDEETFRASYTRPQWASGELKDEESDSSPESPDEH